MCREGRRSQGRSPLWRPVFTFSNIPKPHQQVLVSSMEIPETTELDHVDPDGEEGRWKNLKILKFKIAETNRTG